MNGRDDLRDAVGAFALGVLPEREAIVVRDALRGDSELLAEYAALRETADVVALSAEATFSELDELAASRLKRRVMLAVRAPAESAPSEFARAVRRGPGAWLGYGIAAAAVLVAAASYASNASLHLQVDAGRAALERTRAEAEVALVRDRDQISHAQEERRSVEAILSEHAHHYRIPHGDVVSTQGRLYLALTKLRSLPQGKVYQAWTFAPGRGPIPGATFVPQGDVTIVALGAPAPGVFGVALTVEPRGGSSKPTSSATFLRRLE